MTGGFPTVGNGWIIIQQTDDVHEQVVHLLTQLRRLLSTEDLPRVVPVPPYTIGELKIRHALNQPLHLNFRQTPLREAVFYVQQALNIPIVLNQKRLEEAGIDVDKPVTLNAPEGPARLMLELVLEPLKLTYLIREEVLQITTPEDSESQLITRIYDVRPLLATTFNYDSLPKLIEDTIEQSSWATVGGPGSTHIFQDLLIVGQTEQVHRQLEQWLDRELTKVESTGASAQGPEDRQEAAPTGRSGKSK
jgi:type II secretory pathway component GspD/PulD (secretin)